METDRFGDEWDAVADLVVVGSGAAASAAAATAAAAGAHVIVLEKTDWVGGTTAKSGGVFWVPDNPHMRSAGVADPRNGALRYMARTAFPTLYRRDHPTLGLPVAQFELIASFYDNGHVAISHLMSIGALDMIPVDYPDYHSDLVEDEVDGGRVLAPRLPDGWRRGVDPTAGQILVDGLLASAQSHGAEVRLGHRVVHLVRDDEGQVIGVEARTGTRTVLIGARRGVVFGTGGFIHDPELCLAHLRGPVLGSAAAEGATGDFVRIGIEAGAKLGNMPNAWWDQVVVELAITVRSTIKDISWPFGDSMLMVNKHGVRVVNEKATYNDRAPVHFAWDPNRCEYPNLVLLWIFDQAVLDSTDPSRFRWPIPFPGEPLPKFIASADDLPGLAAELRRRLASIAEHTGGADLVDEFDERLAATVRRFNEMAAKGVDDDFHRGESRIEQVWAGEPARGLPSACLAPLSPTGPYYGIIVGPGALDTNGGPVIDAHARVVAIDGTPIPGLYGAGNCIAAPSGRAYWGAGGTVGPAMVFGYVAARHALAAT